MPEFPEKPTKSKSTGQTFILGSGLPLVKSISGYFLNSEGWHHKHGNTYERENDVISFDGVHWVLNGDTRVEFMHEIKNELNKKK